MRPFFYLYLVHYSALFGATRYFLFKVLKLFKIFGYAYFSKKKFLSNCFIQNPHVIFVREKSPLNEVAVT